MLEAQAKLRERSTEPVLPIGVYGITTDRTTVLIRIEALQKVVKSHLNAQGQPRKAWDICNVSFAPLCLRVK